MSDAQSPLRIAVNALNLPRNPAGISQYVRNLYTALAELPEVGWIEIHTSASSADFLQDMHPKVRVRRYPVRGAGAGVIVSQCVLPMLVGKADILHSVGNVASLYCGVPQLVTVHDLCHKTVPDRFGPVKRAYLHRGLLWSTRRRRVRFVCVSANTLQDLARHYPLTAGRATVVHSAARYPVQAPVGPRGDRLLCVGTIEPGKNLSLAFQALALLKKEGCVLQLDVVGARGWKQSGIPAALERLGVKDQVRFASFVDENELVALYRQAACLVFPSRYEGFGFPILEAQSQGCPVIVADNSCMREVGGDGALYFRDDDANEMAARIKSFREGDVDAPQLVERGYANVKRFSWERAARETLAAMRSAVTAFRN